jgi:hypothetical protein
VLSKVIVAGVVISKVPAVIAQFTVQAKGVNWLSNHSYLLLVQATCHLPFAINIDNADDFSFKYNSNASTTCLF